MDEQMTVTELAAAIPEYWSETIYDVLLERLPFNSAVARNYEGTISNLGDTVNVTQIPEFDLATELTEGQRNDADAVTPTGIQLVVNKMLVKDFKLTKRGMIQSIDVMQKLRDLAAFSIMRKMQQLIIADIVPSSSAPDHQISYNSSTTLALVDILAAFELLNTQNVGDSNRQLITGSAQFADIFNITGLTSRDFSPNQSALTSGTITQPIMGFNFNWTTEVGSVSYFFVPEFFQIAVQLQPVVEQFNAGVNGERGERINVTMLYGQKQFDSKRVVMVS